MPAQDFDFGVAPQEITDEFKLWPKVGDFTALIDGDMVPYIVGYTTDIEDANRAYRAAMRACDKGGTPGTAQPFDHNFTSPELFAALLETPEFQNKVQQANWIINDWVGKAGADSAIIYLTTSLNNYRNALAFTKPYKGQRNEEKPPFFYEIKHYLATHHEAIIADGMEADDLMSIEMWRRHRALEAEGVVIGSEQHKAFSDCAIVSKDKDLKIVPGWNVNPDTAKKEWVSPLGTLEPVWKAKEETVYEYWPLVGGEPMHPALIEAEGVRPDTFASGKDKGKVKTKRIKTGTRPSQYIDRLKGTGLKFFYAQLIMGDQVDNYPGIPGMGPKVAYELLDSCTSEEELFNTVRDAYKQHYAGGTSEKVEVQNYRGGKAHLTPLQMMIEQGRLAHMQTRPGELWRAKNYCPTGEDEVWFIGGKDRQQAPARSQGQADRAAERGMPALSA